MDNITFNILELVEFLEDYSDCVFEVKKNSLIAYWHGNEQDRLQGK